MSKSHIEVANMPEGFQVLGLEVCTCKTSSALSLVVRIQTPWGIAKIKIPIDADLVNTLGLNYVTPGHYY
jgi:hypothetical protein